MKTLDHRPYTGKYFDSEDFDRGIITRLGGKIATNFTQMLFVNQSHRGDWYFFMLFVEWMTKTRLPLDVTAIALSVFAIERHW
jgi:hypothetical protein